MVLWIAFNIVFRKTCLEDEERDILHNTKAVLIKQYEEIAIVL